MRILLIISALFSLLCNDGIAGQPTFSGEVKKVIDGDSLLILSGKRTVEIRLYGIDAPEFDQPFAQQAKSFIGTWTNGRQVTVHPRYVDSYGRTVATITRGKQVLNGDLVYSGLAWLYPRYCREEICRAWQDLEGLARRERRGLWRDMDVVAPWQWKRMKKGN